MVDLAKINPVDKCRGVIKQLHSRLNSINLDDLLWFHVISSFNFCVKMGDPDSIELVRQLIARQTMIHYVTSAIELGLMNQDGTMKDNISNEKSKSDLSLLDKSNENGIQPVDKLDKPNGSTSKIITEF